MVRPLGEGSTSSQSRLLTMPGNEDDPIAEDVSVAAASISDPPALATDAGGGDDNGKPKLSKEQIAAISADIAAVTKTMQEQLAAISQEVNALKGQIDGGAVRIQHPLCPFGHICGCRSNA